ncbi:ribosome-recycling factor, mitochondrial isoform X2 [Daphnia magna]|uniref:Ribosome-recycling factor, mitochondrial n=1 Tax=Daphnia magna TaxID=35525 RepID=A0A0P5TU04_9CRUS|nr:ribosome-recycling factor, mitochondrial isoform X2 [Daphnia magna]KZS05975.1 Ribosome-recycling factor, mitochondrial [Daphnia magna]
MSYYQPALLLCKYNLQNVVGRYAVRLFRKTEKVSCDNGGLQSMNAVHQPKVSIARYFSTLGTTSLTRWSVINQWNTNFKSERFYSKGKEKGDKKKKGPVPVNETEIGELVNVSRLKEDLQKGFDQLKSDYMKHLSLRSASGSIENLQVNFEGETYTLQEIAQIGRKGSQLIVVNLSGFPTVMKDVLKAINDSGMGLNPQQDGTTIFIPVPKVTKEYRESLAKNAKILFQKFKDHCRDIQNKYIREVKKKEKEVSSDLAHSVQQQIHSMAELYVSEGEKVMIDKQNELLGKD